MMEILTFDFSEDEIDQAVNAIFTPRRIERGVGYCENTSCEEFCKAKFLLYHEGSFFCQVCFKEGFAVEEVGKPVRAPGQLFGEVKVEYCYCPSAKRYRELAIVRDEALGSNIGVYTLQSPLIQTEKRALKVAEALLSTLNDGVLLDEDLARPPHIQEKILSWDKPLEEVREWLKQFALQIKDNPFYHEGTQVVSQSSEKF